MTAEDATAGALPRIPQVSLVVCTTGAPERMAALGQRLTAVLERSPDFEIVVVDNSANGDVTMPDPRIRVVRCALPGVARARATGCMQARGAALVCTDDDVDFSPDWPAKMAAPLLDGRLDAVAAPVRLGPEYDELRSTLLREWLAEGNLGEEARLIGAGMAFHRRVLGFGLWDERIGAGQPDLAFGEETLFEWMIRAAGARIDIERDAEVVHHPDRSRTEHDHFLRIARQKGLSDAYSAYHWLGERMPRARLRRLRRRLRLRLYRLSRRRQDRWDEEELRLVESAARAEGFAILAGEPRAYLFRPLARELDRTAY